jgi:hypothetical protein
MKVWAVGVIIFFGLAELYQWFNSLSLSLPIYGAAGLVLALASNAKRWRHLIKPLPVSEADPIQSQRAPTDQPPVTQAASKSISPAANAAVELPFAAPEAGPSSHKSARSISFTIHRQR